LTISPFLCEKKLLESVVGNELCAHRYTLLPWRLLCVKQENFCVNLFQGTKGTLLYVCQKGPIIRSNRPSISERSPFLLLFCAVADKEPEELAVHRINDLAISYNMSGKDHFHFVTAFGTKLS
jgi:hypothetical protein